MEKETLEEAAEHNYPGGDVWTEEQAVIRRLAFKNSANWQAKRMYSEEDLREAFKQSRQCKIFEKDMPPVHNEFEDWFEQFKKK